MWRIYAFVPGHKNIAIFESSVERCSVTPIFANFAVTNTDMLHVKDHVSFNPVKIYFKGHDIMCVKMEQLDSLYLLYWVENKYTHQSQNSDIEICQSNNYRKLTTSKYCGVVILN